MSRGFAPDQKMIPRYLMITLPSWRFLAICLATVVLLLFVAQARARDGEAADINVLVFENGRPVPGLRVEIGKQLGLTNADGAWRGRVEPGRTRLAVYEHALALAALQVQVHENEVAQYIITLSGSERKALVSIESSHQSQRQPMPEGDDVPSGEEGSGMLVGRVVSTEDGSPVSGARVFVSGTPVEARTDENGQFRVEVPAGEYAVSVLHSEFATRTVEDIAIRADSEIRRDFELPPSGLELAEYVVVEPHISGSLSAVFDERRESASVTEVLGAEQISRAGDSDAGEALKRVTGLTLIGGKFIFIRGLGERYSSTLLNGATVPSPDPTRKVVPLDLFPAGVIESIRVQKGYSPEFPGDFGGGAVEIRTRGIPEENFFTVGASTSYRDGTTFDKGRTYPGGSRDWLGFDDGTRELPAPIRDQLDESGSLLPINPITRPDGLEPEEIAELGRSLPNVYDQQLETIGPDRGLSARGGMRFDWGDWSAGFQTAALWSDGYDSRQENRRTFTIGAGELQLTKDFLLDSTRREVRLSGVNSIEIQYGEDHGIQFDTIVLRLTSDDTEFLEGFDENERGDQTLRLFELEFQERQLLSNQLQGEHVFSGLGDLGIDWKHVRSRATRDAPDNRIVRFDNDRDSPTGFRFSTRSDNNFRNFSNLTDEVTETGVDLSFPVEFGPLGAKLSAGLLRHERERDSEIIRLKFDGFNTLTLDERRQELIEEIIGPNIGPNNVFLRESTRPTDKAEASLDIDAWYLNVDMTLFDRLRLAGGFRIEDWVQESSTFELFTAQPSPVSATLSSRDRFPSISATWSFTDRHSLLASYAETIVRPDLREISPAPFTDPVLDREVRGNPDLVQSELQHYDLRYDFAIAPTELLSFGLFYKLIQNPIERGQQPGQQRTISFNNVQEAEVYGAEFEIRKELGFLGDWFGGRSWMERFGVAGNLAWINSEITVDPEDAGILTSDARALQGQSPYVVNLQLAYDHPNERFSAAVLYNVAGERISEFGVLGQPDLFEQPSHRLDANFAYQWSDLIELKIKLGNLLDSTFRITQGDEITQEYASGRTFSLGVNFDF
jgi:outer membrane receptor protein involved in Fe transport